MVHQLATKDVKYDVTTDIILYWLMPQVFAFTYVQLLSVLTLLLVIDYIIYITNTLLFSHATC